WRRPSNVSSTVRLVRWPAPISKPAATRASATAAAGTPASEKAVRMVRDVPLPPRVPEEDGRRGRPATLLRPRPPAMGTGRLLVLRPQTSDLRRYQLPSAEGDRAAGREGAMHQVARSRRRRPGEPSQRELVDGLHRAQAERIQDRNADVGDQRVL